jgi:multiple sugar transport system permease protein
VARHAGARDPLHCSPRRLSIPALALLQRVERDGREPRGAFRRLENFRRIVESGTFWLSLRNTIVITIVSQFFVMVFANILATALFADFRGKWLVRLLILLPWVAPISLGSIGWLWIFDSIYSIINWTARAAGLLGPNE